MAVIALDNDFQFDFDLYKDRVRLILLKDKTELACRKERFSKLIQFADLNEGEIFKGRIKLFKWKTYIEVHFKNQLVGIIDCKLFLNQVDKLRNLTLKKQTGFDYTEKNAL